MSLVLKLLKTMNIYQINIIEALTFMHLWSFGFSWLSLNIKITKWTKFWANGVFRSSPPEVLLGKTVLICCIFSKHLFLKAPLVGCFCVLRRKVYPINLTFRISKNDKCLDYLEYCCVRFGKVITRQVIIYDKSR